MLLNIKKKPSYLEIGVEHGQNFFSIKAENKTAVDPQFAFTLKERLRWSYKNLTNLTAKYYEVTSDKYFETVGNLRKMDIVFIDGLHTYEQSLKDALNSLEVLKEGGVIIMHDCNPPHKAAAYPSSTKEEAATANIPGWTGEWCGDVWKTVCYLRSTRKDLNVFVLDTDYGLGIITKRETQKDVDVLPYSPEQIETMTYEDLASDRDRILGLKNKNHLVEFLRAL
jgi:hypothetical protein